jgi:hypothetical protein
MIHAAISEGTAYIDLHEPFCRAFHAFSLYITIAKPPRTSQMLSVA